MLLDRWAEGCDHHWVPSDPMIEWRCTGCGTRRDGMPKDGPDLSTRFARWCQDFWRAAFGWPR